MCLKICLRLSRDLLKEVLSAANTCGGGSLRGQETDLRNQHGDNVDH